MGAYLRATGRAPVADAADRAAKAGYLSADEGVEYDEVLEIVSNRESILSQFRNPDPQFALRRFRTFQSWNLQLTALSPRISLPRFPNSVTSSLQMDGKMKCPQG